MRDLQTGMAQKGDQEKLEGEAAVVNLVWDVAADMDLAALCVDDEPGEAMLVYYGMRGTRCGPPFAHLAIDHDGGGRRKMRREHLVISNMTAHDAIYLFAWDHDSIVGGRSNDSVLGTRDWTMTIMDRHNRRTVIEGAFSGESNLRLVGALRGQTFQPLNSSAFVRAATKLIPTIRSIANLDVEIAA